MVLRNGKFYEGDELVPLEFGNKNQIALLEKVEAMRNDGVVALTDEWGQNYFKVSHTCVCGYISTMHFHYRTWNKKPKDTFTCSCGFRYELDGESYNPIIIAKLLI